MRFGVLYDRLAHPGDYASLVAQVEAADQLGIDSVWLAAGRSPNPCGALAVVLAALARRTRVVRLGAFRVLGLDHPVRIAEDFAMVDLFAGGRLNFGVAPAEEVAEALPRFSEALEVVLTAWTADPFSFAGQYYRFPAQASGGDGVRRQPLGGPDDRPQWARGEALAAALAVTPKPLQQPRPPVFVRATDVALAECAGRGGHSVVVGGDEPGLAERLVRAYETALRATGGHRAAVEVAVVLTADLTATTLPADLLPRLQRLHAAIGMNHVIIHSPAGPSANAESLTRLVSDIAPHLQA